MLHFHQSFISADEDKVSETDLQLIPIEFSLAQSLHFCTMLALPLPPFSGTLSCGVITNQVGYLV